VIEQMKKLLKVFHEKLGLKKSEKGLAA